MTEQYVNSGGARLWTFETGQGVPVMLCSGGPGYCDYLRPVAELINDMARVIRFEQRGCGRSPARPPYDVHTCVQDLDIIRQYYNFDRWIIGGHSWGADLALAYALQYPTRVLGLICIAGGRINNDREWHKEYRRNRVEKGEQLPVFDYPPNYSVNELINTSWRKYIQRSDLPATISQMTIPALFIYGDEDIRPSWPVEQLANLMPKATYISVAGAAHYLWFTHTTLLKRHLTEFFDTVNRERS